MAGTGLYHQTAGSGQPVLLLHPGFADSRIWDPQWPLYSQHFHLVRCDMRGFGRSPIRSMPITYALDVAALLDELDISHAAIVGCSLSVRIDLAPAAEDQEELGVHALRVPLARGSSHDLGVAAFAETAAAGQAQSRDHPTLAWLLSVSGGSAELLKRQMREVAKAIARRNPPEGSKRSPGR